jgi:Tfp pilus assembly protein PilF
MEGINRLIEHYPRHSHLYLVRAGMEEERKQYEPARHDYDQAVLLAPQDAEVYLARATFRLKLNERKEAMADLKAALKYGANPDEVATLMHQATTK